MILGELTALKKIINNHLQDIGLSGNNPIPKEFLVVQAFHISPAKNRDSILRYGLKPMGQPTGLFSYPPAIFLSLTVQALPWVWPMHGEADIWSFCVSPEKLIADSYNPGIWFYTIEAIPFYKLNLLESIKDVYTWGMQTTP